MFDHVMQRDDVGVVERGDGAGFGQCRRGARAEGQQFDGHCATQPRIAGAIDHAHAAGADRALHHVRTNRGAGRQDRFGQRHRAINER